VARFGLLRVIGLRNIHVQFSVPSFQFSAINLEQLVFNYCKAILMHPKADNRLLLLLKTQN
jgi:hypothetical protein